MSYNVFWLASAEQELAHLWVSASDRADISAAADKIDATPARAPLSFGESRGGVTRIAFCPPLAVLFDVDIANRAVMVWDLWQWPAS